MLELTDDRRLSLTQLVSAWLAQHREDRSAAEPPVEVRRGRGAAAGRPGLLDVIAEAEGRAVHAVLGVRRLGEETQSLGTTDDPVLGLFEDDEGLGMVVDALHDAELAPLVLAAVTGDDTPVTGVTPVADTDEGVVLAFAERCTLTVFPRLFDGTAPRRGAAGGPRRGRLQTTLASPGGPLATRWPGPRGRPGAVGRERRGWALALTSLRDLYASGGLPEEAGGDFGPEAGPSAR